MGDQVPVAWRRGALLFSCLGIMYLYQITKVSASSYRLADLDSKRDQLLAQKQELAVTAGRQTSIQQTRAWAATTSLIPTTTAAYAK